MKVFTAYFNLFFIICIASGQADDACRTDCESTYSLHTTDKVRELHACYRGCRLSHISQLTSRGIERDNIISSCSTDCFHAYNTKDLNYACNLGCKTQKMLPTPHSLFKHEFDQSEIKLQWQSQVLQPVIMVRKYCSGVFAYMSSSYVIDADGTDTFIMNVQVSPRNVVMIKDETYQGDAPQAEKRSLKHYMRQAYKQGSRWLNCVEAKAGVPYWTLVGVLVMSLLFVVWICCSLCDDDQMEFVNAYHNKKYGFGGDLSRSADNMEKLPLITVERSVEAGPLPDKKKLIM